MKYLSISDSHITNRTPASRIDNYQESMFQKFQEISQIATELNVEYIFHSGDLFHSPTIDRELAGKLAEIILKFPCPMYVVPGNHDLYGYNPNTLYQTMLGLLVKTKVVKLLDRTHIIETPRYRIEGQPFYNKIDQDNKTQDYGMNPSLQQNQFRILFAHGMLLEDSFLPEVPHTTISELNDKSLAPNVIHVGHFHKGFKNIQTTTPANSLVLNPGSLSRNDASWDNFRRTVGIIYGELNDTSDHPFNWRFIPLKSAKPGSEILSRMKIDESKEKKEKAYSFGKAIESIKTQKSSFIETLQDIIKTQNPNIQAEAQKQIEIAEKALKTNLPYPNSRKIIETIHLENFQGHKDTKLTLSPYLNSIVGPSDKGKSSIIRGCKWVFYNTPKGKKAESFIKTGEKRMSVEVSFNNGDKIKRTRTKSNTGEYIITQNNEEQIYTGFGNNTPPEIINTTGHTSITIAPGIEKQLLLSEQHEGIFLISESPQTKAAILGKLAGTEIADEAMKNVHSKKLFLSKEKINLEKKITYFQEELNEYSDLESIKTKIDQTSTLINQAKTKQLQLETLKSLYNTFKEVDHDIQTATTELQKIPDLYWIQTILQHLSKKSNQLGTLHTIHTNWISLTKKLDDATQILNNIPNIDTLKFLTQELSTTQETLSTLQAYTKQHQIITETLETLKSKIQKTTTKLTLESKIQKVSDLTKNLNLIRNLMNTDNTIKTLESEVHSTNILQRKITPTLDNTTKALDTLNTIKHLYDRISKSKDEIQKHETILTSIYNRKTETQKEFQIFLEKTDSCPLCHQNLSESNFLGGITHD